MSDRSVTAIHTEIPMDQSPDPNVGRILGYWNELTADNTMPAWSDWDWGEIPSECVPHCGVVDVVRTVDSAISLIYRFWGTAHVRAHGFEMTGCSVLEMEPRAEARSVFEQYMICHEERRACLFSNSIRNSEVDASFEELSLRLPFTDVAGNQVVTNILAFSHMIGGTRIAKTVFQGSAF